MPDHKVRSNSLINTANNTPRSCPVANELFKTPAHENNALLNCRLQAPIAGSVELAPSTINSSVDQRMTVEIASPPAGRSVLLGHPCPRSIFPLGRQKLALPVPRQGAGCRQNLCVLSPSWLESWSLLRTHTDDRLLLQPTSSVV